MVGTAFSSNPLSAFRVSIQFFRGNLATLEKEWSDQNCLKPLSQNRYPNIVDAEKTRRETQFFRGFGALRDAAFPLLVEYTFNHKEKIMAEKLPQTLANHVRVQPPFHFFVLPVAAIALILAIINVIRHYDLLAAWTLLCLAAVGAVAAPIIRINALKAQDRVIRLEERMRLARLAAEPFKSRIGELTESQLIAIRF